MSALHRAQGFAGARRRTRLHPIGATLLAACLATSAWATEPSLAYTVQHGDKLIVLAKEMLVHPGAWAEVARFNALPDPDVIYPGQSVNIPLRLLISTPVTGKVISVQGQVQQGNASTAVGEPVGEGSRIPT